MKFFKRLFCRHVWLLNRWHWTHGITGNHPLFIEAEYKCSKCGKLKYEYPSQNIWIHFVEFHGEKEW